MGGGNGKEVKISRDYNVIFKHCAATLQQPRVCRLAAKPHKILASWGRKGMNFSPLPLGGDVALPSIHFLAKNGPSWL